jgi:5-methylcytosine-specific restriction protein A
VPDAMKRGWYGRRWRKQRLLFLTANPLCAMCEKRGYTTAANVVDHIRRHQGSTDPLFWDRANWQSLCFRCHDSVKQQLDTKGFATGCDINGEPLYPRQT